MTEYIRKRPLFFACGFAFAVAVLCSFLNFKAMVALAVVLVFSFLFILPFKLPINSAAFTALVISLVVIASNAAYFKLFYIPASRYTSRTVTAVCEVTKTTDSGAEVICKSITSDGQTENVYIKVSVLIDSEYTVVPSSEFKAKITFFDDCNRSAANGISLYGTAAKKDFEILSHHNPKSLRYILYKTRAFIIDSMPFETSETLAFIKGMIFGDKSDISGVFLNMFDTVGLSHVMSVSGMHLVFSVLLLDFILSLFSVGYKPRAVIAIVNVIAFTFISGLAVSCIRAAIMLFVYYIGRISDKLPDSLTSLSLSAVLIIVFSPYNIASLSLWLSLAATFGLIVLSPCFNSLFRFKISNRILNSFVYTVIHLFTVSLGATAVCIPICSAVFGSVCIASPIVNVLLNLPIQLMFYVGMLGTVAGYIPYVGKAFSYVADVLYGIIEFIVTKCYYVKNITMSTSDRFFFIIFSLFIVLVIGLYVFYKKKTSLRITYLYISAFIAVSILLSVIDSALSDGISVRFVDVGQGNCSVISYDESAVIVDCGGTDSYELADVLCDDRIKYISLVAITHTDSDHICFLEDIVETYRVDRIIYPDFANIKDYESLFAKAAANGTEVTAIESDCEYELFDGAQLSVFVDRARFVKPIANLSAAYKFSYCESSVLYTGDMNVYEEYRFLDYGELIDCDILSVAHHGSATSSYIKFLQLCSPDYSVISVGENNSYNLPDENVVKRLSGLSTVLTTAKNSTSTFLLNEKGYKYIDER